MLIEIGKTLINKDHISHVEKYTQITRTPGEPEKKDYFRLSIDFSNGKSKTIVFETFEDLNAAYITLKT